MTSRLACLQYLSTPNGHRAMVSIGGLGAQLPSSSLQTPQVRNSELFCAASWYFSKKIRSSYIKSWFNKTTYSLKYGKYLYMCSILGSINKKVRAPKKCSSRHVVCSARSLLLRTPVSLVLRQLLFGPQHDRLERTICWRLEHLRAPQLN